MRIWSNFIWEKYQKENPNIHPWSLKNLLKIVDNAEELFKFSSLRFEKLKGNKDHLYSIRVNDQYRIEFEMNNTILKLADLPIIDELSKHYGK